MALDKYSRFFYGIEIDETNNTICLQDQLPSLDLTYVRVRNGSYSHVEFVLELKRALDEEANQVFSISFNRSTRKILISGQSNFNLIFSSLANSDALINEVLGFSAIDYTGSDNYESDFGVGSEYNPQFWLQDYVALGDEEGLVEASINKTASGKVEVIKFGNEAFISFSLKWITNQEINNCGSIIRENLSGLEDLRKFMKYLITKGRIEFMEDEKDPSEYITMILEKTPESTSGTRYKLKEQVSKGIPDVYETGVLTFKVINVNGE